MEGGHDDNGEVYCIENQVDPSLNEKTERAGSSNVEAQADHSIVSQVGFLVIMYPIWGKKKMDVWL